MALVVVISFLSGAFVGAFIGTLAVALCVMAKSNVEDVPETPIGVIRDNVPALARHDTARITVR